MKIKIAGVFLLLLCIIPVAGCQTATGIDDAISSNQNKIFQNYSFNQESAQINRNDSSAISSDGYYYTANRILWFYDISNNTNIPMCSKANCNHNDSTCDAYVYETNPTIDLQCNCDKNEIFYYNDNLYMIEKNNDNETTLCQYNKNFNEKKSIATISSFAKNQTLFGGAKACSISDGYFYYYIQEYDMNKKDYNGTFKCMRINLAKDNSSEELGQFEFAGDYAMAAGDSCGLRIFAFEKEVFFVAGGTSRAYSKSDQVQYRIAKYNKTDNKFEIIWTYTGDNAVDVWGQDTGVVSLINENIAMDSSSNFYVLSTGNEKMKDSSIVKKEANNNSEQIIYATPYSNIQQIASDGNYLYIIENDTATNVLYFTALDYSGDVIQRKEIIYSDDYLKWKQEHGISQKNENNNGIIIYCMDERYILLGAKENGYDKLSTDFDISYIVEGQQSVRMTYGAAILNKKDFLSCDNTDFKQIYKFKE